MANCALKTLADAKEKEGAKGYLRFLQSCEGRRRGGEVPILRVLWGHKGRVGFFGGIDVETKTMTLYCGPIYGPYKIGCDDIVEIAEIGLAEFVNCSVRLANTMGGRGLYDLGTIIQPGQWLPGPEDD